MGWQTRIHHVRWFDLNSTSQKRVVIPVENAEHCTIQAFLMSGTWSTAVVTVRRSNEPGGNLAAALSSALTITPPTVTSSTFTQIIDCTGFAYLVLELTTVESAPGAADFLVCFKWRDGGG